MDLLEQGESAHRGWSGRSGHRFPDGHVQRSAGALSLPLGLLAQTIGRGRYITPSSADSTRAAAPSMVNSDSPISDLMERPSLVDGSVRARVVWVTACNSGPSISSVGPVITTSLRLSALTIGASTTPR